MKVYGFEVTRENLNAVNNEYLIQGKSFKAFDVDVYLQHLGVPLTNVHNRARDKKWISMRAADRIITKWKKDGFVKFSKQRRRWVCIKDNFVL